MGIAPAEMTLDELAEALVPLLGRHVAFDGWTEKALAMAAADLGVPADRARIALPGGPTALIDAWFAWVDRSMAATFPPERIAAMKVRERIGGLIRYRLDLLRPDREALRRALAILAMPHNAALAARLAWRGADSIWRVAGDTATDYNHYSKRATLIAVYASTTFIFLDDDSEDLAVTQAFLDRRIQDVMRFEQAKARWTGRGAQRPSLVRFLGRLRYPA